MWRSPSASRSAVWARDIEEHFVPGVDQTQQLEAALLELLRKFQDAGAEADLELLDEADTSRAAIVTVLDQIEVNRTAFDEGEVSAIRSDFEAYFELARPTTEEMIAGGLSSEVIDRLTEMTNRYNVLNEQIEALSQNSRISLSDRLGRLRGRQKIANWVIPITSVLSIVFLAVLARQLFSSVKNPIDQAVEVADQLSRGNMEAEVMVEREDEIDRLLRSMEQMLGYLREMAGVAESMDTGDLRAMVDPKSEADLFGRAFRDMWENLRGMIGRVKLASGEVAAAASGISSSSTQITQGAETQSASADETLSTMVEIASQIDSVAKSSQALAINVDQTSSSIQEMGASIEEVAKNSTNLLTSVDQTSSTIEEMAASIQSIEAKVRVVDDVSREAAQIVNLRGVELSEMIAGIGVRRSGYRQNRRHHRGHRRSEQPAGVERRHRGGPRRRGRTGFRDGRRRGQAPRGALRQLDPGDRGGGRQRPEQHQRRDPAHQGHPAPDRRLGHPHLRAGRGGLLHDPGAIGRRGPDLEHLDPHAERDPPARLGRQGAGQRCPRHDEGGGGDEPDAPAGRRRQPRAEARRSSASW